MKQSIWDEISDILKTTQKVFYNPHQQHVCVHPILWCLEKNASSLWRNLAMTVPFSLLKKNVQNVESRWSSSADDLFFHQRVCPSLHKLSYRQANYIWDFETKWVFKNMAEVVVGQHKRFSMTFSRWPNILIAFLLSFFAGHPLFWQLALYSNWRSAEKRASRLHYTR